MLPVKSATALVFDGWCIEMAFPWGLLPKAEPITINFDARYQGQRELVHLFNIFGDKIADEGYLNVKNPASSALFVSGDTRIAAEQKNNDDASSSFERGLKVRDSYGPVNLVWDRNPDFSYPNDFERLKSGYGSADYSDLRVFAVEEKGVRNLGSSAFWTRQIANPEDAITASGVFGKLSSYQLLAFGETEDSSVTRAYFVPKQGWEYGGACLVKKTKGDNGFTNRNAFFDFHKRGTNKAGLTHDAGVNLTVTKDTDLGCRFGTGTALAKGGWYGLLETIYIKGPLNKLSYSPFANIAGGSLSVSYTKYPGTFIKRLGANFSSEIQNRIGILEGEEIFRRTVKAECLFEVPYIWANPFISKGKNFDNGPMKLFDDVTYGGEIGIRNKDTTKAIYVGYKVGNEKASDMGYFWVTSSYALNTRWIKVGLNAEFYDYRLESLKQQQSVLSVNWKITRNLVFSTRFLRWLTDDRLKPVNNLNKWGAYAGLSCRLRLKDGRAIDSTLIVGDANSYKIARKVVWKTNFPL
ncbi:MAG: hypothetical protein PHU56_01155 [Candidatus Pacebacteria bacterium]|nr:hypothetical protein [Candidatus Paceibacterota bacterium]